MVKKLSRKEAQEVTRTRLIEVATRIFTRDGFERASVDTIAREAGMTKGAVYANFATKEDLFLAVLDHFLNQEDQMLETIFVEPTSTRRDALRTYFVHAFPHRHDWRLLITEFWLHAARNPTVRQQYALRSQKRRRKIAQFIEQYLSEEGRKGSLASEVFASVVIAVSNGLEMQQIIDSEAIPDDLFATILPLFVQQLSQPNSNLDLFS